MARRNHTELAFPALSIEGGLLAPDFLNRIAHLGAADQTEADYNTPPGLKLRDEIGRYWKIAQNLWRDFADKTARADVDTHALTTDLLIEPLLRHVFGFGDLRKVGQVVLGERIFPIGYFAGDGRVPVIVAAHDHSLEKPDARFGDGARRRSPFLLAQEYLNASNEALWAVVTNGKTLRILRNNPSLTRPAYIEADLEAIFNEGLYPDFTALWLLAHASRFGVAGTDPVECPLERWRNTAQEDGVRARDRLRDGVTEALRALGTGYLAHPGNTTLRDNLQSGVLTTQAYFEQLLRLVYRLIFLATIEDRELVFAPGAADEAKARYMAGYSLKRLRRLASQRRSHDRHADIWQGLVITFAGLGNGQAALGLPALGGLFATSQCPDLDAAQLDNASLLSAIYSLCFFRDGTVLSRVNYRDMDSEELGSVYESLLELVPQISLSAGTRSFGFIGDEQEGSTRGNARKLTGSYYTPTSLVEELIKSALEPVIERTLREHPQEPVQALLSLSVCDPACGSGHFLLAAARRVAEEVARLNASDGNPLPSDYRNALREVVAHCIYGVDRNPMAVELARTALWLEAYTPERPLTFLDSHLRCGDALLGVLDPSILDGGIPDKAFNALSGDDSVVANRLKKANREARRAIERAEESTGQFPLGLATEAEIARVEQLPDDTLEAVEAKRRAWSELQKKVAQSRARLASDLLVAAFVSPKLPDTEEETPTSQDLWLVRNGGDARPRVAEFSHATADRVQAFHWWQAFPHVEAKGGFDVLLGNPPWEVSQMGEEEFFAAKAPSIAALAGSTRKDAIAALKTENPLLWSTFLAESRRLEALNNFYRESGRFELTAVGKLNTYPLFAETFSQLVNDQGRAGFIVPTGIATDDSTKAFFAEQTQRGRLVSLYDIENREAVFPSVHRSYKFCLLTLGSAPAAEFACFTTQVTQLADARRRFKLTPEEFALINPNTLTCPMFRSEKDAELTKKIYRATPVLISEGSDGNNPWGIRFSQGLFNMTSDSHLFANEPAPGRLPLYEAKMMHQFDHRWATYGSDGNSADVTEAQKTDPNFTVTPRYWVDEREVWLRITRLPDGLKKALKDNNTDQVVLCATQLLFGWFLADLRQNNPAQAVYPAWQAFVKHHPYAQAIAPVSLGLVGQNPSCLKPLNDNYLPGVCEPDVILYKPGAHKATGWFEVDLNAEQAVLAFTGDLRYLSAPDGVLNSSDAVVALAEKWLEESCPKWLMGWRDICRSTDERTVIASVLPLAGVGHTMPIFASIYDSTEAALLLANLSSLALDFIARVKVGGTHLTYGYLKQFPVFPPSHYSEANKAFITCRVLELVFTSTELKSWAEGLGYQGKPFPWNPGHRAQLRAELDAYYARLYGLTRDELRYILDPVDVMGDDYPSETFRVLKNNEIRDFGEYRTQRLVLEAWDKLETGALQ